MVPKDLRRNKRACFAEIYVPFGEPYRSDKMTPVNIKLNCESRLGLPRRLISESGEYTVLCDDRCSLAVLLLTFTTLRPLTSSIYRRPSISLDLSS